MSDLVKLSVETRLPIAAGFLVLLGLCLSLLWRKSFVAMLVMFGFVSIQGMLCAFEHNEHNFLISIAAGVETTAPLWLQVPLNVLCKQVCCSWLSF